MFWIDVKLKLPSALDADKNGKVLWQHANGSRATAPWDQRRGLLVAWASMPEFVPLPELPEGFEILKDNNAEPHPAARVLRSFGWASIACLGQQNRKYDLGEIYCVPIAQPAPQYRPFESAEEFEPHRDRWWKFKSNMRFNPPQSYTDLGPCGRPWPVAFLELEFDNGEPFGVQVDRGEV